MKAQCSTKTACGDTTKTLIDTITVPQTVKAIIGFWAYAMGGAGMTTLENVSGIVELESDDLPLTPMQFPLDIVCVLTSGSVAFQPRVWGVNIPVNGGEKIRGYMTMDMAITVANTGRFGFIYN